ncbi:hypothetical protein FRB97_009333 [Tulasnella sp. 331]|nr:hypothetical protein FRB97_009333 [Tulasnella sp. 331]
MSDGSCSRLTTEEAAPAPVSPDASTEEIPEQDEEENLRGFPSKRMKKRPLGSALLLYKIVGMVALMALSLVDSTTELVAKTSLSDKWTSASIDSFLAFFSVMYASLSVFPRI